MAATSETWSIPAVAAEIGALRRSIVRYATGQNIADPPISDIKLAVCEAVTNAIVHGYTNAEPGTVTVLVNVDTDTAQVTVTVTDDGSGMHPRPDSPGLGLGLPLITTVAKTAKISAGPGGLGTLVKMTFGLDSPGVLT